MFSITGGYKWWALDSIPNGSDYKVKVTTLDGSFEDMSEINFTIIYIPVNVEQIEEITADYRLEQNYPNPFNPSTIIRYSIPIQSKVNLTIYNSIGENIAEIIDLTQNAGSYEVEFDGSELSSGIYFYRLQVGSFIETKKMILLR